MSEKLTGLCIARPIGQYHKGDRISFPTSPRSSDWIHGTVKGTEPANEERYPGCEMVYVEEDGFAEFEARMRRQGRWT